MSKIDKKLRKIYKENSKLKSKVKKNNESLIGLIVDKILENKEFKKGK